MANKADNFASLMDRAWKGNRSRSREFEDANFRAKRRGAEKVHSVQLDEWKEVKGDMPASLWRFKDGSEVIIGDDGSFIRPTN